MAKIEIDEQIACVKREIAYRERCYPKWSKDKPEKAAEFDRELARMQAVLKTLEWLEQNRMDIVVGLDLVKLKSEWDQSQNL